MVPQIIPEKQSTFKSSCNPLLFVCSALFSQVPILEKQVQICMKTYLHTIALVSSRMTAVVMY